MELKHYTLRRLFAALSVITLLVTLSGCGGGASEDTNNGGGSGGGGGGGGSSSADLAWEAPVTNTDGSCLQDLSGYRVHYGTASGNYPYVETVMVNAVSCTNTGRVAACGNIQTCTYTVRGLSTGQWFFAVTAFNAAGDRSTYSNEASKTIN